MKTQKIRVCELINANFLEYQNQHCWDFKNKDYIENRKSLLANQQTNQQTNPEETHDINVLYLPPKRGRGKANAKHLLVAHKLFKEMLMLCQTSRGKRIRIYYVDLEETISLYFKYQCFSENLNPNDRVHLLFSKNTHNNLKY